MLNKKLRNSKAYKELSVKEKALIIEYYGHSPQSLKRVFNKDEQKLITQAFRKIFPTLDSRNNEFYIGNIPVICWINQVFDSSNASIKELMKDFIFITEARVDGFFVIFPNFKFQGIDMPAFKVKLVKNTYEPDEDEDEEEEVSDELLPYLTFYQLNGYPYYHPHINYHGLPCLGDTFGQLSNAYINDNLTLYFTQLKIFMNIYTENDSYIPLNKVLDKKQKFEKMYYGSAAKGLVYTDLIGFNYEGDIGNMLRHLLKMKYPNMRTVSFPRMESFIGNLMTFFSRYDGRSKWSRFYNLRKRAEDYQIRMYEISNNSLQPLFEFNYANFAYYLFQQLSLTEFMYLFESYHFGEFTFISKKLSIHLDEKEPIVIEHAEVEHITEKLLRMFNDVALNLVRNIGIVNLSDIIMKNEKDVKMIMFDKLLNNVKKLEGVKDEVISAIRNL